MWAAQHCSMLFSSALNRVCIFCCVTEYLAGLFAQENINKSLNSEKLRNMVIVMSAGLYLL